MSQKTDQPAAEPQSELSNAYLGSLATASAIVLVLVFWGSSLLPNPLVALHVETQGSLPWLYPWILGAGVTIANGLTEFSGHTPELVPIAFYSGTLMSLLLSGVLGPTVTLLLMGRKVPAIGRGIYFFCLIVTATITIAVVPTGYSSYLTRLSLRESLDVSSNRDQMINEISVIAWKTHEYQILPRRLGGGEGSLEGYTLPTSLGVSDDATYVLQKRAPGTQIRNAPIVATIHAASRKYPDTGIEVSLGSRGELYNWTYTGKFQ